MRLRVKICGITQSDQAQAIVQLGATALGFICVPGTPRYVTPEKIRAIASSACPVDRVGVFLNAPLGEICETVAIAQLTAVQLHGSESPQFCAQLRAALPTVELIKALRVSSSDSLQQVTQYGSEVDTLLLDAYHPHLAGGTGQTIDWHTLQTFRPDCPWLLAGGLTPDNVQQALSQVRPDGIDLSSGVERAPGDKDLAAVARLFQALRQ